MPAFFASSTWIIGEQSSHCLICNFPTHSLSMPTLILQNPCLLYLTSFLIYLSAAPGNPGSIPVVTKVTYRGISRPPITNLGTVISARKWYWRSQALSLFLLGSACNRGLDMISKVHSGSQVFNSLPSSHFHVSNFTILISISNYLLHPQNNHCHMWWLIVVSVTEITMEPPPLGVCMRMFPKRFDCEGNSTNPWV